VDFVGDKTECALLQMIESLGYNYVQLRSELKKDLVTMYPFTAAKKRASVVYKVENGAKLCVAVKGASEIVLQRYAYRPY